MISPVKLRAPLFSVQVEFLHQFSYQRRNQQIRSEDCVEIVTTTVTGITKSGPKTDHEIQEKDHHPSVNYLNKMIFQTCFLLLGLQLTNAVLLSQEEDAKIQAAYPNLKTRPRIARRLREGKIKQKF